ILSDEVSVYKDIELTDELIVVNLFDEVHVISKYNDDAYKIKFNDEIGFVKLSAIDMERELKEVDIPIQTLLPYLSEQFNDAYYYYLSFLGQPIAKTEENLIYMDRVELSNGDVMLEQSGSDIKYHSFDAKETNYLELSLDSGLPEELVAQMDENGLINKEKTK